MTTVLLTGATGVIGSALVPRFLSDPECHLVLLIRAPDERDLGERLSTLFDYWRIAADDPCRSRVRALRGDITVERFGLDIGEFERLGREVTHIVHCAASVKLNMSPEVARSTAVGPTRVILELARAASVHGQLRKVDLVSTVGVWGRSPGLMPERRLPEVAEFHNTYEAAKAEAERVVWREGDGLPITVHRPSMVVGDSVTGMIIHFQVFYHICEFLSGARTFGVMPLMGDKRLDTVPVDWVADAIHWASRRQDTVGRIFHLCSGPERSISMRELQKLVRELWRSRGRRVAPIRPVPSAVLRKAVPLLGMVSGERMRRSLRALPPLLEYLAEEQGFSNSGTVRPLAEAGIELPGPGEYLPRVLGYYLAAKSASPAEPSL